MPAGADIGCTSAAADGVTVESAGAFPLEATFADDTFPFGALVGPCSADPGFFAMVKFESVDGTSSSIVPSSLTAVSFSTGAEATALGNGASCCWRFVLLAALTIGVDATAVGSGNELAL